ncbi:MAG: ABC transporter permease [Actinobacteria bacterium]|nr:MAG: ABC transporter permease [Actinomycetota bacterium]
MRLRRALIALLAPASALILAVLVSSIAVLLIHQSPLTAFKDMAQFGVRTDSLIFAANEAIPLFVSGLAVAIGFKMGLFNIGVEGQYTLAALLAAYVGAVTPVPGFLRIILILLVAMTVGAAWASVAGILKVTRGVHEVISTIMLNFIAFGFTSYLLAHLLKQQNRPGDFVVKTKEIPSSGLIPSLNGLLRGLGVHPPAGSDLYGFLPLALALGIVYYVLIWRTRFGFDLRASGFNPNASRVSGVDPRSMVLKVMILSGAVAGLVGMPDLFGLYHRYTIDFVAGLGFTGIAVALVGRNHPVGIALAAFLFGFLDRSAQVLDLVGIPKEITIIMRGVIILCVVIAYEVVRRVVQAQEVKAAAERMRQLSEEGQTEPVPA